MATLRVVRSGLMTTVQDLGRWGYQSWGVSPAGPMDPWAHRLANRLVGNDERAALLEITLTGPELVCDAAVVVAVTGALFDVRIITDGGTNPRMLAPATAVDVPAGATLAFGTRRGGARAYLAVRGGFDVPPRLGSRATHLTSRLGGIEGRALRPGDLLAVGAEISHEPAQAMRAEADLPRRDATVRLMLGPHADWFEPLAVERLLTTGFVVGSASDRMAFRLEGPALPRRDAREMVSEATASGHVQVPPLGPPMLLMADRQTVGGYPTIATVISADLGVVAQLAPGDGLRFTRCDRTMAIRALVRQEQRLLATAGNRPGAGDRLLDRRTMGSESVPGGGDPSDTPGHGA